MELVRNSKNPNLATLDPGPLCNLACSTCNDDASTRWQAITGRKPRSLDKSITVNDLDWKGIQSVVVCGGEPILHASLPSIVEYTANHSIKLIVHFNGTVRPSENFLELVKQHYPRKVGFRFSIDGVGRQFEYLRWPGKWDQFVSNTFWMRDNAPENVTFSFNFTQSILNSERYQQVVDWVTKEFKSDIIAESVFCDKQIAGNFSRLTDLSYFNRLDLQRSTNWKEVFPEIAVKYTQLIETEDV